MLNDSRNIGISKNSGDCRLDADDAYVSQTLPLVFVVTSRENVVQDCIPVPIQDHEAFRFRTCATASRTREDASSSLTPGTPSFIAPTLRPISAFQASLISVSASSSRLVRIRLAILERSFLGKSRMALSKSSTVVASVVIPAKYLIFEPLPMSSLVISSGKRS